MERALTKIDQYNTNQNPGGVKQKGRGLANLDPLPQFDGISKIL